MMEAERNSVSEQPDSATDSDQADEGDELESLIAIKKTRGDGRSRWHLFGSLSDRDSLCGHIEADRGRSNPSNEQQARKLVVKSPEDLDDKLGRVCQNCTRVWETKQPGYTLPSIREGKLPKNQSSDSIAERGM